MWHVLLSFSIAAGLTRSEHILAMAPYDIMTPVSGGAERQRKIGTA